MRSLNKVLFYIKPCFAIVAAVAILLFPLKLVIAWAVASGVHELFHIITIRIMKVRILSVTLDCTGSIIETESMHPLQEFICALSGPLGGLLLLMLARIYPETAVCAILQSVFNLLPYYPLDGGRALHNMSALLLGEDWANRITACCNIMIVLTFFVLAIIMHLRYHFGMIPLFLGILLFLRSIKSNYTLQTAQSDSTI